jgi:hypothetical protein
MISRRHCKCIAQEWVLDEGLDEYNRRMDSIDWAAMTASARLKLDRDAADFMLHGYYDPPAPRIPGFFARLFLSDWTPPERTDPMYTGAWERERAAVKP